MPEDLQNGFDADSDAWLSDDKEVEIKKACVIRLRLLGVMCDTTQITAVGTIKDDFLGLISHPDNQGF
jgi:DNA-directed RNA polymerase II subunit RPB7